ncbi:FAD-dependent oxidoreductase [Dactylosporangium matsuzakiense]|uniref:Berberine-like enzyme n=1 Tax=Dactylosporangium matsuzakiense TaxID=53360 RepID=A0A9W6KIC3_9ACTN|nr:FAD-dependent oxidoreductase [Dactylosporangium matsuzakiense]UWZ48282.1 BBE domain-containing protein [Dactylosporangium matsuzakiense]GLL01522.1 hypothetical protein GCM10017581_032630 [Dactylosporangium matsuzakiense]
MPTLAPDGEIFTPDSPGYDAIRRPANPAYRDARPRLAVRCRSVADVVSALAYATATGERLVPRGGGHCFAGRSSTGGILLTVNLTLDAAPGAPVRAALTGASTLAEGPTRELLREFPGPAFELRAGLPYHRLKQTFSDPDDSGRPRRLRSEFFAHGLSGGTLTALLGELAAARTGRRQLTFTAMGGAYNRVAADATAFAHRGERFLLEHIGDPADDWVERSWAIAHADGSGRVYPNFPDLTLDDWAAAYHADNHGRLVAVKRTYNPHRFFDFPQAV